MRPLPTDRSRSVPRRARDARQTRRRRPRHRRRASWPALVLTGLVLAVGCGGPDPAPPEDALSRSEFIEVVVALRNAEIELEAPDSVYEERFRTRRDSILDAHGITQRALYEFLNRHPDLQYMDAVWDTITQRTIRRSDDPRLGPSPVR